MPRYDDDPRVVMTLDAGGTSFRFAAMCGNRAVTNWFVLPSNGHDLQRSLDGIVEGFTHVKARCPRPPAAISFAFPAPAPTTWPASSASLTICRRIGAALRWARCSRIDSASR